MSDLEDERRRLREGAGDAEPPGELDQLDLRAADPGRALERVREVLDVVLAHGDGAWPDLDEWKRLLPRWFVDACVDDREIQNCVLDRWSLRAWLHWLQPSERKWRWWDASVGPDGALTLRLLVQERPYLRGSLDWLLKTAGASLPD
jgi:hypothetical protein